MPFCSFKFGCRYNTVQYTSKTWHRIHHCNGWGRVEIRVWIHKRNLIASPRVIMYGRWGGDWPSISSMAPLIARFVGPTWGPPGADRTQVDPMLATRTLLSGTVLAWWIWMKRKERITTISPRMVKHLNWNPKHGRLTNSYFTFSFSRRYIF